MLHALIAPVTLMHFSVSVNDRRGNRTHANTLPASDAPAVVAEDESRLLIAADAAERTRLNTRRIVAMHAGNRKVSHFCILSPPCFLGHASPQRKPAVTQVDIVLIHTGNGAGTACYTAVNIQINIISHRMSSSSAFRTLHGTCLYPGNPVWGSR